MLTVLNRLTGVHIYQDKCVYYEATCIVKFLLQARNIISDFGMFFATVIMVSLSVIMRNRVTVETIKISENGYDPTIPTARGWFISPLGVHTTLSIWAILGAILPATLVCT